MKLEEFKAGHHVPQYQYHSFQPERINREWTWNDSRINVLLETAGRRLGELNSFTQIIPDVDLFIRMHIIKEANTSSRIEGTKTNIDEAVLDKMNVLPEKRDDWQEVQNYIKAINVAIERLRKLPISTRLLRETHEILLNSGRGEHKSPGDFRKSQNWIGGSNLADAVYIPPVHDAVPELMSDLENFLHNEQIYVPDLLRIALAHYQFETIHPFLDGNGRIGRLMITLYLVYRNILCKPSLYLSAFFEKHRASYYDALSRVRESNDIIHWVKFFLNALIATAESGVNTFQKIISLKADIDKTLITFGRRAEKAQHVMELLYQNPTVDARMVAAHLNVSPKTAYDFIELLQTHSILTEMTQQRRNKLYTFEKYLGLFLVDDIQ